MAVEFRGARRRRHVDFADSRAICNLLSSVGDGKLEGILLESGDYEMNQGGLPLMVVSFPDEREFAFLVWHPEIAAVQESRFGQGIAELDEVLQEEFSDLYCFSEDCLLTAFGSLILRDD